MVGLIQDSSIFAKTLREMCGEYHPENAELNKRWYLPVGSDNVPVFVMDKSKAEYPEIRLFPFWEEDLKDMGIAHTYTPGDASSGEHGDLMYHRAESNTTIREIRSVIEIYGESTPQTLKIRDKLFERFERFRLARHAETTPLTSWVQDGNVYKNANYHSNLGIFRVYDSGNRLIKTPDVANTEGSWYIDDTGILVNPLTTIDKITFDQIYNGGFAFYNGDLLASRGIMSIRIVRSKKERAEEGPDVPKWVIHTVTKYKDIISFDIGQSFSKVNINERN